MGEERALREALERAQARVKELETEVERLEAELADALDANAEFAEAEAHLQAQVDSLTSPPLAAGEARERFRLEAQVHSTQLAYRTLVEQMEAMKAERERWVRTLETLGHRALLAKLRA